MNRNVIIAIIIAVAAGGYYQFSYKPAQVAKQVAEQAAVDAAAAKKATDDAAAAAQKAADDAAAAAKQAADDAAAAAKKAADDAAAAAASTAATATTAATTATTAMTDAMTALDPANFDAAKLTAMIDGSSLDDATKNMLKTAVTAAAADPTKVPDAVAQVKKALGM